MYARVTAAQVQPGKIDEGIQIVDASVVPVAKQQPGFKGLWLLADRSSSKTIVISLWETEAAMRAEEANDYWQEQIAKVAPVLASQPVREAYEVSIYE